MKIETPHVTLKIMRASITQLKAHYNNYIFVFDLFTPPLLAGKEWYYYLDGTHGIEPHCICSIQPDGQYCIFGDGVEEKYWIRYVKGCLLLKIKP